MSRSKRLGRVANAASQFMGHHIGGCSLPKAKLIQPLVLLLLVSDVLSDHSPVASDCRNEVPTSPEVLPNEVPLPLALDPREVDLLTRIQISRASRDTEADLGRPTATAPQGALYTSIARRVQRPLDANSVSNPAGRAPSAGCCINRLNPHCRAVDAGLQSNDRNGLGGSVRVITDPPFNFA